MLANKSRGFSCPQEELDETFLSEVVIEHSTEVVHLFLERYRAELQAQSEGLLQLLTAGVSRRLRFSDTWDPSFGGVFRVLRDGAPSDAISCATSLALFMNARGLPGCWLARLPEPRRLQLGHCLLPEAQEFSVSSDGTTLQLQARLGGSLSTMSFAVTPNGCECLGAESLPRVGKPERGITLLSRSALAPSVKGRLLDESVTRIEPEMVWVYQAALDLLATHAPVYLSWVERVLQKIWVLEDQSTRMRSGNSADEPGLVHISLSKHPMPLAEMLVHEASHQYFNILTWLGPVDDGRDRNGYHSPLVNTLRPLRMILLGYHAFANVLLLYRLCRATGVNDGGYCERQEKRVIADLERLEIPLRGNESLTVLGRGLCDPLIARLRA